MRTLLTILLFLALVMTADAGELAGAGSGKGEYAINLSSTRKSLPDLPKLPKSFRASHTLYVMEFELKGELWHRLRLGFFPDKPKAEEAASLLQQSFPQAWVTKATPAEIQIALSSGNPTKKAASTTDTSIGRGTKKASGEQKARKRKVKKQRANRKIKQPSAEAELAAAGISKSRPGSSVTRPVTPATTSGNARRAKKTSQDSEIDLLIGEAKSAFEIEDYDRAIRLYTKLLKLAAGKNRQQSLEMLGVSRELNRQLAHAKKYYRAYLQEYPDTEGAQRVKQRLAVLISLGQPANAQLKQRAIKENQNWRLASHLSQFYQQHTLKVGDNSSVPINGLFNDYNLIASKDGTSLHQEARVTMSYLNDFTDKERLKDREFQLSSAYWEGFSDRLSSGFKIGRQSRTGSGVPGRFDGMAFTSGLTSNLTVDLTGGFLVDSSFDSPDSNRPFVSISGEYASDGGSITIEPFFMQQYVDSILDRRAIGTQIQVQSERAMIYSLLDYDIYHSALNNMTFKGNFRIWSAQLSASYEHRKSPYLTTQNALIGQQYADLSEMEEAILDLQLEDIASDRTATSKTIRVGLNTSISEHWTITADVVASDFSKTESSADVMAMQARETLYSSFQVRSVDIFGQSSYSALMIRHIDSDTSTTTSLYWDNRFSLRNSWRIYPRIRVDQQTFDRTGDEQLSIRPTVRLEYSRGRRFRFQVETGYQLIQRDMINKEIETTGLFIRAGYRASF